MTEVITNNSNNTIDDANDTKKRIKAIMSSASGNLVEWYDFYAYSFTAIYFSSQFFPSNGNRVEELLKAAGVFLIGFLMRPIGGWLFGYIADKYGRKKSLMISVLMMCFGSLFIAILPTYETIGLTAIVLLVLIRMMQGLSVGGEYGTTAAYMSEVALKGRRGFFSSFQYVTLVGGQLLASLVVTILAFLLDVDQLKSWGWRIPFFIGALAALVALYLRFGLHETTTQKERESKSSGNIVDLLRHHSKAFFLVLGFTAGGSLTFYTYTTYMQKYLITTTGFHENIASTLMTGALFIFMCLQPLFGSLADKIGTRKSLLIWSALSFILTIPVLNLIGHTTSPLIAFLGIVAMLVVSGLYTSIGGIVKAEMFPAHLRALGVGLSYAIANALFGGSAEYVALKLKDIGLESTFYYYVTAMMAIAFIAAYLMPDARKSGYLQGDDIH